MQGCLVKARTKYYNFVLKDKRTQGRTKAKDNISAYW